MAAPREDVYCTLVMSDSYLPGAAILARSLQDCGTTKKLAALITRDTLLPATIEELKGIYDYVLPVDKIASSNIENLARLDRLDLRFTFTKIALWRQEQFRKIVYIDADIVALRAPDELFDIPARFAAAPDIGWPDCFNSGVMVLTPDAGEYWSLHTLASNGASFDGADQGLLNEYYANRPWHRLSFTYNCTPSASYQYEPAYRHYKSGISLVHFIGREKPWNSGRQAMTTAFGAATYKELLSRWWAVFDRHYKSAKSASASDVKERQTRYIRQYVHGEQTDFGWAASGQPTTEESTHPPPALGVEKPITDRGEPEELVNEIDPASQYDEPLLPQNEQPSIPTFNAPQQDWDPTRSEPPRDARPEAVNFPREQYEMSRDRGLFQAPQYREPPKDMYYKVPDIKPAFRQEPKPIFPWEQAKVRTKATRVFAEDTEPAVPPPAIDPTAVQEKTEKDTQQTATRRAQDKNYATSGRVDPWQQYTRTNAWDEVPSIDQYVRAVRDAQTRRGRVQVLHQSVTSPDENIVDTIDQAARDRRDSLRLTDFPSELERPSLPVTPAAIHRPTFWGEERDAQGELPVAQGVPEQADWNPIERLEELRRASLIASADFQLSPTRDIPNRDMPETASIPPSSPPAVESMNATSYVSSQQQAAQISSSEDVKSKEASYVTSEQQAVQPSKPEEDGGDLGWDQNIPPAISSITETPLQATQSSMIDVAASGEKGYSRSDAAQSFGETTSRTEIPSITTQSSRTITTSNQDSYDESDMLQSSTGTTKRTEIPSFTTVSSRAAAAEDEGSYGQSGAVQSFTTTTQQSSTTTSELPQTSFVRSFLTFQNKEAESSVSESHVTRSISTTNAAGQTVEQTVEETGPITVSTSSTTLLPEQLRGQRSTNDDDNDEGDVGF